MTAIVLRGDAAHLPLPDASVDLIVTSPPYFGLRSYTDGGEHYESQIGSEATPAAYVAALIDCTREWMRVLKPSGSLFVNLGDKYGGSDAGSKPHTGAAMSTSLARSDGRLVASLPAPGRPKSLLGLPWRYALACIDELGLILRAEIIWSKPNGLPESVTDRVRRSHEQLFHFTRLPRYYSAVDEIREPSGEYKTPGQGWISKHSVPSDGSRVGRQQLASQHPLGKLPGSVWDIPSQPLTVPPELGVDHFAAFPMELPRRIVLGWSPPGICTACGEGRRPVADSSLTNTTAWTRHKNGRGGPAHLNPSHDLEAGRVAVRGTYEVRITGYACACPTPDAPTRPSVVLDPFSGTGTTALVASVLGRTGIGVDRSSDYCRLAQWRTSDRGERARALQVPKPPQQLTGQEALWA